MNFNQEVAERIISLITREPMEDEEAVALLAYCLGYFTGRMDGTENAEMVAGATAVATR